MHSHNFSIGLVLSTANSSTVQRWTHFPLIHVDLTNKSSVKRVKSASAPKFKVPFVSVIFKHLAGCSVAHSIAYTVEQSKSNGNQLFAFMLLKSGFYLWLF